MNLLVVHAHPEPRSFTAALKDTTVATAGAAGHVVAVSDLYAEGFDPVGGRGDFTTVADPERFHYQSEQALAAAENGFAPEILREQRRLAAADLLVLHFPIWWGAPPAILKGWFDRVLAFGFAYRDGTRFESGLLAGKTAVCALTTGGTPKRFSEGDAYGPIEKVLWPVQRLALEYLGMKVLDPFVAYAAPRVDDGARAAMLAAWAQRLSDIVAAA
ncbi:NAD(P)H-dependent oxidoreductase [Siculibacillus lacustris]|nr:NAD(P)H-dependent oxidoreductase [Siculibacillus lacustris]